MNFDLWGNNDIFDDFFTLRRKKKEEEEDPLGINIPDNLLTLTDTSRPKAITGAEAPDSFTDPGKIGVDPKDKKLALYEGLSRAGMAMLRHANDPNSNIGLGLVDAFSQGTSTYADRVREFQKEAEDRVDNDLIRRARRDELARSAESHDWARERFGREGIDWQREDEAREELEGSLESIPEYRRPVAKALIKVNPGLGAGMIDTQFDRREDKEDSSWRADEEERRRRDGRLWDVKSGLDVPERERYNRGIFESDRNYERGVHEFDTNKNFTLFRGIMDDTERAEANAARDAEKATRAQMKAISDKDIFLDPDVDPDTLNEMSGGKYGELYEENRERLRGAYLGGIKNSWGRAGSLFGDGFAIPDDFFDNLGPSDDSHTGFPNPEKGDPDAQIAAKFGVNKVVVMDLRSQGLDDKQIVNFLSRRKISEEEKKKPKWGIDFPEENFRY